MFPVRSPFVPSLLACCGVLVCRLPLTLSVDRAQVKCTDKCKCEDCKNMAARPDETPRERADQCLSALLNLRSSSKGSSPDSMGRNTGRKGGHSMLSPPRNKKPRVLDFNVTATPSQSHGGPQVDLIQALVP